VSGATERLRNTALDLLQTALRLVPWPTEPGLRAVGEPDAGSPVIVTGNYDLTVRRVMRALAGSDVWLVVAPSSGINVWCAAAGGHLGTHQVVTALKTSGISELVQHRRVILPQLAATGVVARDVTRRCGWKVRFGPVYAADLPRYLAAGGKKDDTMRRVRFGAKERLEMALMWAAPTAAVLAAVAALLRPAWILPLGALTGALALAVFFSYDRFPSHPAARLSVLGTVLALGLVWLTGGGAAALIAALALPAALVGLLTFDYPGSTPIEGGSHFDERGWQIALDLERCRGVFSCVEVCPEACFERQSEPRRAVMAAGERCIRCGACVVQCPQDALRFEDASGAWIEPDTIRQYKLNLLGKRSVHAGPE